MHYQVYMRHRVRTHLIQLDVQESSLYMAQRVAEAQRPDYIVTRILISDEPLTSN